jgi:hypothetical protein
MKKISDYSFFWFFLTVALGFVAIKVPDDWYQVLYAILSILCLYEFVVTLMNRRV